MLTAQVDTTTNEKILFVSDEMPSFPGGESEMVNFLKNNLKYPEKEKEAKIMGKCYITFVVEKNGALTDIKLLKGIPGGPGCDAEAMRVVKMMPNWNPGKQKDKEARVQINLPIQFRLLSADSIAETDTTYFNSDWKECTKAEAEFYRTVYKHENGYLVKDMYIENNLPQMIAVCNVLSPLRKNGKCTFYYKTGKKEKEGNYIRNEKDGVWNEWYENGQKKEEIGYNEGKYNGSWYEWYENGQKKIKQNYVNGKYDGMRIEWDIDGKDSSVVECFSNERYRNIHLSKNQETAYKEYNVFYPCEEGATFPGGENEMSQFIINTIDEMGYPRAEKRAGITGTCYVTFVVEKDGNITDIRLLRGVPKGTGYNKLAMDVVKRMPVWKPGMQFGKAVRVQFNLPIRFTFR